VFQKRNVIGILYCKKTYPVGGLIGIVVSMVLLQSLTEKTYAISPSFSRQTFTDNPDDWSYMGMSSFLPFKKDVCTEQSHNFNLPDISAVDYFSDGKSLNATLWLSSGIEPPISPVLTSFQMLIDISSTYDTGQDYLLKIEWNNSGQNWVRTLQDISPSSGKNKMIDDGEYRILEKQNYNTTHFFETGKNYIELNTMLQHVSSPDQYSLVFIASSSFYTNNGYFCNVIDIVIEYIFHPQTLT
jgi:hypothetical protein